LKAVGVAVAFAMLHRLNGSGLACYLAWHINGNSAACRPDIHEYNKYPRHSHCPYRLRFIHATKKLKTHLFHTRKFMGV
jgi:hypothetical protein